MFSRLKDALKDKASRLKHRLGGDEEAPASAPPAPRSAPPAPRSAPPAPRSAPPAPRSAPPAPRSAPTVARAEAAPIAARNGHSNGVARPAEPLTVTAAPEPIASTAVTVAAESELEPVLVRAPAVEAITAVEAVALPEPARAALVVAPEPTKPAPVSLAAAAAAAAASGKNPARMLHADTGSTDIDAYIARAKANGRALTSITGGIGLNRAEDGTVFWGPVDNASSRAKAAGRTLTVDQVECISCGTCVEQTDKVFYLPADGKATPIAQEGPMDLIEDAIEACPVTCIHWVTPEEADERGLATGLES